MWPLVAVRRTHPKRGNFAHCVLQISGPFCNTFGAPWKARQPCKIGQYFATRGLQNCRS
jgi:hypothetical protein